MLHPMDAKKGLNVPQLSQNSEKKVERPKGGEKRPLVSLFFFWSIILSFIFHVGFIISLPHFFSDEPRKPSIMKTEIIFKEKTLDKEQKQVVELPLENKTERPKDADYVADEDHRAKKETRAPLSPEMPLKLAHASASPTQDNQQESKKEEVELAMEAPTVDDFFRPVKKTKSLKNNDPLGLKDIQLPTSANNDFLKDVDEGDKTDLNAWQWRHAPFFNRVKAAVGRVWAPNLQISRYDPQGQLLGQKDRTTIMSVTIDFEGKLRDLKVAQTSGVAYLDEEAERTFKAAAPFPFPPKELFANQQEFTFKFAFHLAINRGLSFDFDWDSPN